MEINSQIKSEETLLVGSWKIRDGKVVGDEVCSRIQMLKSNYLKKVAQDESSWETLYQDPSDGRYWLLTYPNSEYHGGGAPTLKNVTLGEIRGMFEIT